MNYDKNIGKIFDDRYRINRVVGEGGMAVVYEATDLSSGKRVAVKMLKESISDNTQALRRFINESKAVAMLNHPNIVKIVDVSVKTEHKFIVMEYIKGITLRDYMNKKVKLGWQEATAFIAQILQALDHAHMKGVIHRDIKPQNIMVMEGGIIKVADFGIAKIPNAETVTMVDHAVGTIYYISPEQAKGKKIDARSDLYSLGVMFYEMVAGQLPFMAESSYAIMHMHINDAPKPPKEHVPQLPLGVEQIILCAMEKEPNKRYQSASQMHRHILRIQQDPTLIFQRQTPPRTPTAEVAIQRTTRNTDTSDKEETSVKTVRKPTPTPTKPAKPKNPTGASAHGNRTEKGSSAAVKRKGAPVYVPFSVVIVICVAFLLLAAVGFFVIFQVLYHAKMSEFYTAFTQAFQNLHDIITLRTGMKFL
ncbi:MAG: serine/threonine protein kinase [Clostridia bacterium]|nr:serine/threonine protein kinase [Clostridia bacterium]